MTPDEAVIYSADNYMRALVDLCIETKTTTITRASLPEQLKCKWYRRSIALGYLKRVNESKSCSGDTWTPAGMYLKLLNTGLKGECDIKYSEPLTIKSTSKAISKGHITCKQISYYLGIRFTTTFRALKRSYESGELDRESVRNVYHYSLKEA